MKIVPMEVALIHSVGEDLTVVNAARVSFHKTVEEMSPKEEKLIGYLADHDHHSPFNHSFMTFRVKAPIFVARQLVKHKFMPWNEVSRRYVDDEPEFYFPENWRGKADNVKQGSSDVIIDFASTEWWEGDISTDAKQITDLYSLGFYSAMIASGVCPEQARMVLPQNTMTEWWWSGTLGAFLDMLKLRLDPHTQAETREVAQMIAEQVKQLFPISYEAYLNGK